MANSFLLSLNNISKVVDDEEAQIPFNNHYKRFRDNLNDFSTSMKDIVGLYDKQEWRNIDSDWLEQSSRLALYMDTFTNNSSLVLAIEMVKSGKVLLFPGDAQIGNWLSWDNIKFQDETCTIDSLLSNTVLYKVGHHGSHNATLKAALEKMTHPDLVAMIPVDLTDGNINRLNGWKMPALKLLERLKEKTSHRVLTMDFSGFAEGCDYYSDPLLKKNWNNNLPINNDLYVEYTFKG